MALRKIWFVTGLVLFACPGLTISKVITKQGSVFHHSTASLGQKQPSGSCFSQGALTEVGVLWGLFVYRLLPSVKVLKLDEVGHFGLCFGDSSKMGKIVRKIRQAQLDTWLGLRWAVCGFHLSEPQLPWWTMTFSLWCLLQILVRYLIWNSSKTFRLCFHSNWSVTYILINSSNSFLISNS